MNDRFLNFLRINGWELKPRDPAAKSYDPDVYVKVFNVMQNGEERSIPVQARFFNINNQNMPGECTVEPLQKIELSPTYHKRVTLMAGSDRIVTCLDQAGLMTAMKYLVHCFPIKSYKKQAKLVLERTNALPT